MFRRLDHVGLVVRETAAALRLYRDLLGLPAGPTLPHPREGVKITFLRAGDSLLELIEPTDPTTGVARFLEKRGEGLHHLCYEVADLRAAIQHLQAAGLQVLDREPRRGLHGEELAFIHPRSAHGVLLELYQAGSRQHPVVP